MYKSEFEFYKKWLYICYKEFNIFLILKCLFLYWYFEGVTKSISNVNS